MDPPSGANQTRDGLTTASAHLIRIVRVAHALRHMARTRIASPRQVSRGATNAADPGSVPEPCTVRVRTPLASRRRATVKYARAAGNARAVLASLPSDPTCGANQTRDGLTTASAHLIRIVRVTHALRHMARTGIASPRQVSRGATNAADPGSVPEPCTVRVRTPLASRRRATVKYAR